MQVLNETENKLIGRKEIRARITYDGATPNRQKLLKEFKAKNVIIRQIKPEFGSKSAIVNAVIYASKEIMDKLETKSALKKHVFEEPKKEAETKEDTPQDAEKEAKVTDEASAEETPKEAEKKDE